MHPLDHFILIVILLSLLGIGLALSRKSGKDTAEFLVAGRKMPWWLIGLSDIAVGLNTSNMLQESRKVRQDGIMGLIASWGFAFKNCVHGVFFERLWRRARFKTQMEFYEARYSGWQAKFARIYDTVIFGGFVTCIWASVGLVGMKKVATTVMGLPPSINISGLSIPTDAVVVIVVILIALTYSVASGARGIYWTDMIEFAIAMVALYTLAVILYMEIGGSSGLRSSIENMESGNFKYLNFFQPLSIVYLGAFIVNPLLDHGGFNPGMQRTLSLKDEREVLYCMIFRGVAGFVLRGMPFIAIGLIGMFLVNDQFLLSSFEPLQTPDGRLIPDFERALPVLVNRYLPIGLTGLMTAAFVCAFMSSFDSNIHLTGSLFINDLYRPFLVKNKDEHHYVLATKAVMTIASLVTIVVGIMADDLLYLGYLAITISLGAGWIKLLRIIWWRVNGAADVASQIAALFVFAIILSPLGTKLVVWLVDLLGMSGREGVNINDSFIFTRNVFAALLSTVTGLIILAFSKPEPMEKLCSFYKRMRPFGFWGPVRAALGDSVAPPDPIGTQIALVLTTLALIWGSIFGSLCWLLAYWEAFGLCSLLVLVGAFGSRHFIRKLYPVGREIVEFDEHE